MARRPADAISPRILLVKTSSLGDVLHNLPVVSDIVRHYPDAQIDWVVEESFASLPRLHPRVRNVIAVAVRRWRHNLLSASTWREIMSFRSMLRAIPYDVIIDTQGLLKSALLMRSAKGLRCGFDRQSAREPLAASLYEKTFRVPAGQHAVERNRQLAAQALGYALNDPADYGILPPRIGKPGWLGDKSYAVLLHATSRTNKLWAEPNWVGLGRHLRELRIYSILPWGNATEQERSQRLAGAIPDAITPPRLNLNEAAALLGNAKAAIGVDTGLAHLAAALGIPTVGIYTATDPALTGLYGGRCAVNLGNEGRAPEVAEVIEALQGMGAC